jgi:hypothetical protein
MNWFARHRESIILGLTLLVAGLLLANLIRHGILSASALSQSKDALSALQSAVQILFIVLGAIFSYYRFFRGRTFVSRAIVDVDVAVIETTRTYTLHWVTLEFKNLGTVSVWAPRPEVIVRLTGPTGTSVETWDDWREASTGRERRRHLSVVDSGETISFTALKEVPVDIWAVEYQVFVTDSDGVRWKRAVMVPNRPAPNKRLEPTAPQ